MGRQNKVGLDYFELDCHMDDKVKLIQAEYGLKGFAVFVRLLQKIYGENGYYCEWTQDLELLFASENGLNSGSIQLLRDIVSACIRRDIFSERLFKEYGILSSTGVQKQYLKATAKREVVELKKEYLLVSIPKTRENVVINAISDGRNAISDGRSTQSREEYRKEDIKDIVAPSDKPKATTPFFDENSFEIRCVDILIKSCIETFPNSKVPVDLKEKQKWAVEIERMKRIDKRSETDIMAALNFAVSDSFWKPNIRSGKKFREKFETLIVQSKGKGNGSKRNQFNRFEQRDYDFDELERELMG